jgi:hypothetical protein
MVAAVITILRYLPLLLAFLALPPAASAHQLDEYLQATLVAIEPGGIRLEINLTPGVAVADRLLALIDRDHDGIISTNEALAYAEMLKRDLIVRLDERVIELKLAAFNFPEPSEFRSGWGIIQLEFSVESGPLAAGSHRLTFENRHLPAMSVYLLNAAQPRSGSVQIGKQTRNKNQSLGEIEFTFDRPASAAKEFGIVVPLIALPVVVFVVMANRKSRKK